MNFILFKVIDGTTTPKPVVFFTGQGRPTLATNQKYICSLFCGFVIGITRKSGKISKIEEFQKLNIKIVKNEMW